MYSTIALYMAYCTVGTVRSRQLYLKLLRLVVMPNVCFCALCVANSTRGGVYDVKMFSCQSESVMCYVGTDVGQVLKGGLNTAGHTSKQNVFRFRGFRGL